MMTAETGSCLQSFRGVVFTLGWSWKFSVTARTNNTRKSKCTKMEQAMKSNQQNVSRWTDADAAIREWQVTIHRQEIVRRCSSMNNEKVYCAVHTV